SRVKPLASAVAANPPAAAATPTAPTFNVLPMPDARRDPMPLPCFSPVLPSSPFISDSVRLPNPCADGMRVTYADATSTGHLPRLGRAAVNPRTGRLKMIRTAGED